MTYAKLSSGLVVRFSELLIYRSFHSFPCVILVFLVDSHICGTQLKLYFSVALKFQISYHS